MLKDEIVGWITDQLNETILSHYGIEGYEGGGPSEQKTLNKIFLDMPYDISERYDDYMFFASYLFHKMCLEQMAQCDKGLVNKTFGKLTNPKNTSKDYLEKEPEKEGELIEEEETYW